MYTDFGQTFASKGGESLPLSQSRCAVSAYPFCGDTPQRPVPVERGWRRALSRRPFGLLLRARRFVNGPRAHSEPAGMNSSAGVESRQAPAFRLHEQDSDPRYRDGSLAETSRWTAILTIVVQTPRTPDALRKNPLGIFVNAINWSKELGS